MSRSTGTCESDDGQDDLMSRSAGTRESDQPRFQRSTPVIVCIVTGVVFGPEIRGRAGRPGHFGNPQNLIRVMPA